MHQWLDIFLQPGVWFIGFGNGFPKPNKEKEKCLLKK